MLDPQTQSDFLQSCAQVKDKAVQHLLAHPGAGAAVQFVRHLHRGVDAVSAQVNQLGPASACHAGCHHCCRARVETTAAQVWLIVQTLDSWPDAMRAALLARLREREAQGAAAQTPLRDCAFLQQGLCQIYAVRPASCRRAHSLSQAACASGAAEIPQHLALTLGAEALMRGTQAAYQQLGLDAVPLELCQAVLRALSGQTNLAGWYAGRAELKPGS